MFHLLRLLGLITLGSVGGFAICNVLVPSQNSLSALGGLLGVLLGAYLGIGLEMSIRLMIRRKWKFSLAEVLVAITLLAVFLLVVQVLRNSVGS
jgi:hypothetical protein